MNIRFFLCIAAMFLSFGCSWTDLYYVEKGSLIEPHLASEETTERGNTLLVGGHRVEPGSALVLLMRKFEPGSRFAADDETFEKLTIEIKEYAMRVPIYLNSPTIKFYYSCGTSAFFYKSHGLYGTQGTGSITIQRDDKNKIEAKLDVSIFAKPAKPSLLLEKRTVEIRGSYVFTQISFDRLTPWLGASYLEGGSEVYP